MDSCTINCIQIIGNFSQASTCDFVQASCLQSTLQFAQTYFCDLNQSFILLILLSLTSLALIYTALNSLTNHYLMPCVQEFIDRLQISQGLAGVTFLAFANGAPDVVIAIVATAESSSASTSLLPFGSLYGAALFDMAFLLSMVIQLSPNNTLALNKREALVPLGFYIFGSIYLITVSLLYGKMNTAIASFFLALYPLFICFNLYEERKWRQEKKLSLLVELASSKNNTQIIEVIDSKQMIRYQFEQVEKQIQVIEQKTEQAQGNKGSIVHFIGIFFRHLFNCTIPPAAKQQWTPMRAILSLTMSPFLIILSHGVAESFQQSLFDIPVAVWFSVPSIIFLFHSFYCIIRSSTLGSSAILYSSYSFLIVICWIKITCSTLINLLELLQILTNINTVFLGLTVLAWANCIGDYLSITAFAKKGNASTTIAGIFSGPLFTFLLGFGISTTKRALGGQYDFDLFRLAGDAYTRISNSIVVSVIVMAILYMMLIFVRILKGRAQLGNHQKKFAKIYYAGFILTALVLSIKADFNREHQCQF